MYKSVAIFSDKVGLKYKWLIWIFFWWLQGFFNIAFVYEVPITTKVYNHYCLEILPEDNSIDAWTCSFTIAPYGNWLGTVIMLFLLSASFLQSHECWAYISYKYFMTCTVSATAVNPRNVLKYSILFLWIIFF